jgi:hypothetical protein
MALACGCPIPRLLRLGSLVCPLLCKLCLDPSTTARKDRVPLVGMTTSQASATCRRWDSFQFGKEWDPYPGVFRIKGKQRS